MKTKYIYLVLLLVLHSGLSFAAAQDGDDYVQQLTTLFDAAHYSISNHENCRLREQLEETPVLSSINMWLGLPKDHPRYETPPTLLKVAVKSLNYPAVKMLVNNGALVTDKQCDSGKDAFAYLKEDATEEILKIGLFIVGKTRKELFEKAQEAIEKDKENRHKDKKKAGPKFRKFFNSLSVSDRYMLSRIHPKLKVYEEKRERQGKKGVGLYS